MDFKGALRARLLAAAPVAALVAQRIYWVDRPQASALPAIVLDTITDHRDQHMGGFIDGAKRATVQVSAFGTTYAQVNAIVEAAIAAIAPAHTGNGVSFSRALIEPLRDNGTRVETQFIHGLSFYAVLHHSAA